MNRFVPDTPQIMKQVDDVAWVGCIPSEAREQIGLCFLDRHKNAGTCCDLLG